MPPLVTPFMTPHSVPCRVSGCKACAASLQYELSLAELATLVLVAHGYSNREIADRIKVSLRLVNRYIDRLKVKLHVSTKLGLAMWAVRRGLVVVKHQL